MPTGGQLLVHCLEAQGTDRVFCIPGESYLVILDALYDSPIETIVARHEGGAAMMAEADGKATGRPGICLVTRGPGAANAMSGIHVAQQDSTPMILIIGQVERAFRGRDAFQEVDFVRTFGAIAKLVVEIDDADRIPEIMARAFHTAMSGRPGPVVISVPEDMLHDATSSQPMPRILPPDPIPSASVIASFDRLLEQARTPVVIVGGSRWDAEAAARLQTWAQHRQLPVTASFRRQHLFPATHPCYIGDLGLGVNPELVEYIQSSDLLILLGGRLSEMPSQQYSLLDIPVPRQKLIHIHPGPEELGRVYRPTLAINASPSAFLEAISSGGTGKDTTSDIAENSGLSRLHNNYLNWSMEPGLSSGQTTQSGRVRLDGIVRYLSDTLPPEAIITNGAGNYSGWLHRFFRYKSFRSQFAPTSGSMGYGLPAAIAAKLRFPRKPVICLAGDGCLQMTIQELGSAAQCNANIIVIVVDNGMYGTIRMHQERHFPKRVSATGIKNPDFARLADAYGFFTGYVTSIDTFESLFCEAMTQTRNMPALLHVKTDPRVISPAITLPDEIG